jgi:hypothetical protein
LDGLTLDLKTLRPFETSTRLDIPEILNLISGCLAEPLSVNSSRIFTAYDLSGKNE